MCLSNTVLITLLIGIPMGVAADERTPERWEKAIHALESGLDKDVRTSNATLFIGSSSIRLWDLDASFPNVATVNHGFGGSETSDSVHYFQRLVVPVHPSRIVMYAGDNDIAHDKSPEQVHGDFKKFVALMREHLPDGTPLFYVAIKPSIKRWEMRAPMQTANDSIRATCDANPSLHFVDIWEPMIGDDGKPRPELFAKDGLHLNATGYKLWNRVMSESFAKAAAAE